MHHLALTPTLSPSPSFPLPQGEGGEPVRAGRALVHFGKKTIRTNCAAGSTYRLQDIKWTGDRNPWLVQHVRVNHRGGYIGMPQQLLNGADIVARLQ